MIDGWTKRIAWGLGFALFACAGQGDLTGAAPAAAQVRAPLPPMKYASVTTAGGVEEARRKKLVEAMPDIDAFLKAHAQDAGCPGFAFGVVLGDRLLWSKGYGVKDLGTKAPVDEKTVFRIGSITKTFTGLAFLQLRDGGKLSLDEPVARYVAEAANVVYPSRDSPPITTRHLLTHSSGLPRSGQFDYTSGTKTPSEQDVLASLGDLALESVPGTRASYSNLGFALLGIELGRVTGMTYRDYVTARILKPLAMTSTVWDQAQVPAERLATGYELKNGRRGPTPHWRLGASEAMGGLYSDVTDMAKYVAFQLSAWPPRDTPESPILRRASIRESQVIEGDGWAANQGVGVAWAVRNDPAVGHLVAHVGQSGNYSAVVRMLPQRSLGVIALCSCGDTPERLEQVTQDALVEIVKRDGEPGKPLSGPIHDALDRVRKQLVSPDLAGVQQAFTPAYFQDVPAAQMLTFFTQAQKQSGNCGVPRGVAIDGLYKATVVLPCDKQSWQVKLEVEQKPPYRIGAIWFNPAGRE